MLDATLFVLYFSFIHTFIQYHIHTIDPAILEAVLKIFLQSKGGDGPGIRTLRCPIQQPSALTT
jgi:hypothetical protein